MLAICIAFGLGFCCTGLILLILKHTPFLGLRVSEQQEFTGLDESLHGEVADARNGIVEIEMKEDSNSEKEITTKLQESTDK